MPKNVKNNGKKRIKRNPVLTTAYLVLMAMFIAELLFSAWCREQSRKIDSDIIKQTQKSEQLSALIRTIDSGEISGKIAKTVFEEMFRTGEEPTSIIKRMGLVQVSDSASLEPVIDKIVAANPKQVEEFRSGKTKVIGFFVGQVMKETRGQANPKVVNEMLQKKLRGD